MPDSAWKRNEREIAELLGGRRLPRRRGGGPSLFGIAPATPNVEFGRWRLQVRCNPRLPRWLENALTAFRQHGWGGHCGALVVVRSSQGVPTERWVVLSFDDYRALLQRAGDLDEPIPPPKTTPLAVIAPQDIDRLERLYGPDPLREA